MRWHRTFSAVAAFLLAAPAAAAGPAPLDDPGLASPHRLDCANGASAVIDARPGSGTVFVQIGIRVGSRDDEERLAGISHLLEHMVFQGGVAFADLRASGAIVNATTEFELTEYHADLPKESFRSGWRALLDMVTRAEFLEDDLVREREVVLREVAQGKTDPLAIVAYSVLRRVFPGDPLGRPVIGFARTLRRVSLPDLLRHYRLHYHPANYLASIVGDVDPNEATQLVEATLCGLPGGREPRAGYAQVTPDSEPLYRFRTLVSRSYLLVGALTPGEESPDALPLELLATVLGGGRSSRLHRRLVDEEALAEEVMTISFQVSDTGAFGSGVAVAPEAAGRARTALLDEMERLAREEVSAEELAIARRQTAGRLTMRFETNEGISSYRLQRLFYRQPIGRPDHLRRLESITAGQLREVAARHWGQGVTEIQVLPARGLGKLFAALKFLLFRRL